MIGTQFVNIKRSPRFLVGPKITLPFPPFPGLVVGSLTVEKVFVNQGGQSDKVEIRYRDIDERRARILRNQGWDEQG